LSFDDGYTVATVSFPTGKTDLYVFWHDHHALLFDAERNLTLVGTRFVGRRRYLYSAFAATSTSEFRKTIAGKVVLFPASNLTDLDLSTPWVAGDDRPAIGTVIRLREFPVPFSSVLLINGLFSPIDLALYTQNGRVKRVIIRAYDELGRVFFEGPREIRDTPELQRVDFGVAAFGIDIEIVDTYAGTAFDDMAISAVFFDALEYLDHEVSGWR